MGSPCVIAELDQHGVVVERLDDRADLPTLKPLRRMIAEQRHEVEDGGLTAIFGLWSSHHSTQQVTNRGISSPARTIQMVLTITR